MESRISGHTRLFALIGSPVGHSGAPAMYNYSFARTGVDAAYLAFDIPLEQVQAGVEALKTLHVGGFNVTMPDKTAVAGLVDEISPAAKLIGACNTVTVSEDGKLTGHNTDGIGFVQNLRQHAGPEGSSALTGYPLKATGSNPLILRIPGLAECGYMTAQELLDGKCVSGRKALVVGGGMVGCEAAEFLAMGSRANAARKETAEAVCPQVLVIGEAAKAPGNAVNATTDALQAALAV